MFWFSQLGPAFELVDMGLVLLATSWAVSNCWRNFRDKEHPSSVGSLLVCLALIWTLAIVWNYFQDWRPLAVVVPLAIVGLVRAQDLPAVKRYEKLGSLFVAFAIFSYAGSCALQTFSPFGMWSSVTQTAVQPGGEFTAVLINHDGIAYGYDNLAMRPRYMTPSNIFDWPYRDVVEFVMEQDVTDLRWVSRTHLQVLTNPGAKVVWKKSKFHDITISIEPDPSIKPEAKQDSKRPTISGKK